MKSETEFKLGDLVTWKYVEPGWSGSILYNIFKKKNETLVDKWFGLVIGFTYKDNEMFQLRLLGKRIPLMNLSYDDINNDVTIVTIHKDNMRVVPNGS